MTDVYECWKRAGDERFYTLERYCWGISVRVEEERVAWLFGCKFSRNGQYIVMVRRMRFRWVRGEKVEAERVDDEEDGAFVGGFQRARRGWIGARGDGGKGQPAKQETTGKKINSDEMKKGEVKENPRGSEHGGHTGEEDSACVQSGVGWEVDLSQPVPSAMVL